MTDIFDTDGNPDSGGGGTSGGGGISSGGGDTENPFSDESNDSYYSDPSDIPGIGGDDDPDTVSRGKGGAAIPSGGGGTDSEPSFGGDGDPSSVGSEPEPVFGDDSGGGGDTVSRGKGGAAIPSDPFGDGDGGGGTDSDPSFGGDGDPSSVGSEPEPVFGDDSGGDTVSRGKGGAEVPAMAGEDTASRRSGLNDNVIDAARADEPTIRQGEEVSRDQLRDLFQGGTPGLTREQTRQQNEALFAVLEEQNRQPTRDTTVGGVRVDRRLRRSSRRFQRRFAEPAGDTVRDVTGSVLLGSATETIVGGVNPAALAKDAGDAAERSAFIVSGSDSDQVPERFTDRYGTSAPAERIADTAEGAAKDTVGFALFANRNPEKAVGALVGGAAVGGVAGLAAGRAVGAAGRAVSDRARTRGTTEVDASDLTQESVLEGDDPFPGAQDPDKYESDPAAAVREQADDMTPEEIQTRFDEAGVEGTDLKKALGTDPEQETGFESPDIDSEQSAEFESPGSFFGPELSPNFLRIGSERNIIPRRLGAPNPGLDKPTAVVARTDVENSRASDLQGFNEELVDRRGETTAVTKPRSEVSTGEIEAVVPPGARFSPVGDGGAEFSVNVEGRRVPIRTVAPTDRSDTDVDTGELSGARGGSTDRGETLSDLSSRPRDTDGEFVPISGSSSSAGQGSSIREGSGGGAPSSTVGGLGGGSSRGGSPSSGVFTGGSSAPSGDSSGPPTGSGAPSGGGLFGIPSQPGGPGSSPSGPPSGISSPPSNPGSPVGSPGPSGGSPGAPADQPSRPLELPDTDGDGEKKKRRSIVGFGESQTRAFLASVSFGQGSIIDGGGESEESELGMF